MYPPRLGFKRLMVGLVMTGFAASLWLAPAAFADHDIPAPVKAAVLSVDPHATVRPDALVTFSNGAQYVLVSPAEPVAVEGQPQVTLRLPKDPAQPADLIAFSDGHFLLRMVTLPNGRPSFAIPDDIPIALKSGLLPQDFPFRPDFLMPTAWKSLTGNLLISPEGSSAPNPGYPLAIYAPQNNSLVIWDLAQGQVQRQVSLPCLPQAVRASADGGQVFMACRDEAQMLVIHVATGGIQPVALRAPAFDLVLDDASKKLYLSHSQKSVISVFDTQKLEMQAGITLKEPAGLIALAPFRKQLLAQSIPKPEPEKAPETPKSNVFKFFFDPRSVIENPALVPQEPQPWKGPRVQVVNLETRAVEKIYPFLDAIDLMYVQDDKILWTIGAGGMSLNAFDLRWQERETPIPLDTPATALASDAEWLYLLMPEVRAIYRLSLKDHQWGRPIPLDPAVTPANMVFDPVEHQVYVLSAGSQGGIQVVNLARSEWAGTQVTGFQGSPLVAWLIPASAKPNEQVRIKFQDGRLLIQNAPEPQWATLLSDPRGPRKSQTQPEPAGRTSAPEATP